MTKQIITRAVSDILIERRRQIEAEGWTPQHDDKHGAGELGRAAAVYAALACCPSKMDLGQFCADVWPWAQKWLKPTTTRRNLVKAAALVIAEIERLDRNAA